MKLSKKQTSFSFPRSLVSTGETLNFSQAMKIIAGWADWSLTDRRDVISAFKVMAEKVLKLPPAAVPCDPGWLNLRIYTRAPAAFGMSKARFQNVVSKLRKGLHRLGVHQPHELGTAAISPEFLVLLNAIPDTKGGRALRSGFHGSFRYWSRRNIVPGEVNDAVLADYAAFDFGTRLSESAGRRANIIAAAWNRCVREGMPGWPGIILTAPEKKVPYAHRLDIYPESFRADVEAFLYRLGKGGSRGRFVMATGGPGILLRPASINAREFNIRQAAGILVLGGLDPAELHALRDLLQPVTRFEAILDFLAERQTPEGGNPANAKGSQLGQVAETLRQVARHFVKLEGPDLPWIEDLAKKAAAPRRRGLTPKNRNRLRQIIQRSVRGVLLHMPEMGLMAEARVLLASQKASEKREAARLALFAVVLEILLICPLRLASLLGLRLDRQLQRLDPVSRRITHLVLDEQDMKNAEPLEWPVPVATAKLIEEFLKKFRPLIARPDNPYLVPGQDGAGMRSPHGLSTPLTRMIEEETGAKVHLHLLRHFAAWSHLKRYPGAYEDVRRVLGHRDIETTMQFYVAFETAAAAERFDAGVLKERKSTQDVAAQHFGKKKGVTARKKPGNKQPGPTKTPDGPTSKPEKKS